MLQRARLLWRLQHKTPRVRRRAAMKIQQRWRGASARLRARHLKNEKTRAQVEKDRCVAKAKWWCAMWGQAAFRANRVREQYVYQQEAAAAKIIFEFCAQRQTSV